MTTEASESAVPDLIGDANVSVDVDALDCYRDIHGMARRPPDGHADPLWTVGVERARRLFAACDLSATFFVVGRDLETPAHCSITQKLVDDGHEIANHTYDHRYELRHLSDFELAHQIKATDRIIAGVTGERPVGFRTPGYNVDADILSFSKRAGHRYDASIFSCVTYWALKAAVMGWRAIRGEPSRSQSTDPQTLRAPRQPYFPDPIDCWRPARSPAGYVEIPVAVAAAGTVPIIGTSLHLLDRLGTERLWKLIDRSFARFFNLEMHAIDFVDATDLKDEPDADRLLARQPDLRISWSEKRRRYHRILEAICNHRSPVTLAQATAHY